MADIQQVWESEDGWKTLGLRYFVHQDFQKQPDISNAFDLIISARVLGAQIGQASLQPLQSTNNLSLQLIGGITGSIKGEINDWQGYMPDGKTKAAWNHGGLGSARFLLTLDIDIAVPVPIVGNLPIQVKAFHKPCVVLLHWSAGQKKYVYMPEAG
jgi:hypothetical protein